ANSDVTFGGDRERCQKFFFKSRWKNLRVGGFICEVLDCTNQDFARAFDRYWTIHTIQVYLFDRAFGVTRAPVDTRENDFIGYWREIADFTGYSREKIQTAYVDHQRFMELVREADRMVEEE